MTTVAVVSLVFAYYFLVYVSARESKIIGKNLRVITQIAHNISFLQKNYEKQAEVEKGRLKVSSCKLNSGSGRWTTTRDPNVTLGPGFSNKHFQLIYKYDEDGSCYLKCSIPVERLFGNELIEREDIFDFIQVSEIRDTGNQYSATPLYSNNAFGYINLPDSAIRNFISKNVFDIDLGFSAYAVFNIPLRESETIYLTGFVNKERFNALKREVPTTVVSLAIKIIIIIVLALPIVKLVEMSNSERLYISDAFLTGVALIAGPSILIALSIAIIGHSFHTPKNQYHVLNSLSEKVEQNFRSETRKSIDQLRCVRLLGKQPTQIVNSLKPFFPELSDSNKLKLVGNVWKRPSADSTFLFNSTPFQYFNSIFWTDSSANIELFLSNEKNPSWVSNLAHRKYVMDIVNGRGMDYSGDTIAIESIRSVIDGAYEMGVGINSGVKDWPVLATSFSMASVMEPVMQLGYGFCIYSKEGKSYFHSDISRNLNENFIEEVGENLPAYLSGDLDHFSSINYHGKEYYLHTKQMDSLKGFYIATFVESL